MENNKKEELINYVTSSIELKVSYDEIKKQLNAVGWSDDEVDSAYAEGLIKSGVPIPAESSEKIFGKKTTTVEIVINFFSFILLGIFATSLGMLLYGIINYFFTDKLRNFYSPATSSETIHYAIAALIISFPLYYFTMRFWFRSFSEEEGRVESRLSKWITYLVLLVAAVTIVGDLIVVIFSMLQGEITVRFFLKALTIFTIAGGIFSFYYLERKKVQYKKPISRDVFIAFGWTAMALVIFSIVLGFVASGSPKTERNRNFDNTRANDLQSLASCIGSYAIDHKALPETLESLTEDSTYSYCSNKRDPETGLPYEYVITNQSFKFGEITKGDFELCANFSLESAGDVVVGFYEGESKWSTHGIGRQCDKESVILDGADGLRPVQKL